MTTTRGSIAAVHLTVHLAVPSNSSAETLVTPSFSRDYIGDADLTTCMLGLDMEGYIEQDPNTDRSIFGGVLLYQFYNADGSVRAGARQQSIEIE